MEMLHHSRAVRKARACRRYGDVKKESEDMLKKQWYFHMALWDRAI